MAASGKYRYSKRSGALQEAMGTPQRRANVAVDMAELLQQQQIAAPEPAAGPAAPTRSRAMTNVMPLGDVRSKVSEAFDPHQNNGGSDMFFYTVEDGQRVLMTERSGQMEVIEGPRRVWRWSRRFRPMDHYVAHPGEFLIIRYRDGRQEHLPGPAHCWLDPRVHMSVEKEESVQIAAEEAVVVYSEAEAEAAVTRRIAHGPATFVPAPGEWLHTFSWHGTRNGQKVPNALVFQKLWLLPDQMYHDVAEVRTADDAVLTVRLMLFFRLVNIEQMLSTTHDPIGDFVNAATADVVEFVRKHSFDDFKQNSDQLNRLETYVQLTRRAQQCGYAIDNVVYRGYGAPPALQQMHEKATESRTRLQLEKATEQQAQELEDLKQTRALARAARDRTEEREAFEHKMALHRKRMADERELQRLEAEQAQTLAAAEDARRQAHLSRLAEMGVDLTAFLTADRADRIIELRGSGTSNVHLRADD